MSAATPRARREALRARREALRARREALRRSLEEKRRRRRRKWWLLLLLLLCVPWCAEEPAPPVVAEVPVSGEPGVSTPEPEPAPPPDRVPRRKRPSFALVAPAPLPWLESFRLQVAARSPRLAACFEGAAGPGALKWTASVEPATGRVSDQSIEPTLDEQGLSKAQITCLTAALADPPYQLDGGERATPSRVGLVIEF